MRADWEVLNKTHRIKDHRGKISDLFLLWQELYEGFIFGDPPQFSFSF